METTTIKISKKTKHRLDNLKEYKKETYEEVLRKILWILNLCKKEPEQAKRKLGAIDVAIKMKENYKQIKSAS